MNNSRARQATTNFDYLVALSRAFAGALIFCVPLLMTMEMWRLGVQLPWWQVAQLSLANLILLFGLSKVSGFEETQDPLDDLLDVFAAYFVASVTAGLVLLLIGEISPSMPLADIIGKIAIQAVPGSFGAMIGSKMLGDSEDIERNQQWRSSMAGQLFLLFAGAIFLSFTIAPTEEVLLISIAMEPGHAIALMLISVLLLHAILYFVGFTGQDRRLTDGHPIAFIKYSLPGYSVVLLACLYLAWSFDHLAGLDPATAVRTLIVLAFPGAIGAGLAKVVI
ncbi:TIGR02587 family membrane protein [Sphingomonas xanthus]|uniref:TIGR02587 family membrane protein n=1 Tax=Sphingomonas xanthus TaxID=2594473 RepID=A0A516IQ72_9SPHN|nr:TIGR02587 family membrane protein [Sphingomonas xanthus]QDP19072.1 TIGR02587 family membrane protein [Sphingomonas xanthus]